MWSESKIPSIPSKEVGTLAVFFAELVELVELGPPLVELGPLVELLTHRPLIFRLPLFQPPWPLPFRFPVSPPVELGPDPDPDPVGSSKRNPPVGWSPPLSDSVPVSVRSAESTVAAVEAIPLTLGFDRASLLLLLSSVRAIATLF